MKRIPAFLILWVLNLLGICIGSGNELQNAFEEAGVQERSSIGQFSDLSLDPSFLKDIDDLPAGRKEMLVSRLSSIALATVREAQNSLEQNSTDLWAIAQILKRIGSDEQKIETYRNLEFYGRDQEDAAQVLASCEGPEGIQILKTYGENLLPAIDSHFANSNPNSSGSKDDDDLFSKKFFIVVIALQGAYHPMGQIASAELWAKYFEIAGKYFSKDIVIQVTREAEIEMDKVSEKREKRIRERKPDAKRVTRTQLRSKELSVPNVSESLLISKSKHQVWIGIVVSVFLAIACGFLFLRKTR